MYEVLTKQHVINTSDMLALVHLQNGVRKRNFGFNL